MSNSPENLGGERYRKRLRRCRRLVDSVAILVIVALILGVGAQNEWWTRPSYMTSNFVYVVGALFGALIIGSVLWLRRAARCPKCKKQPSKRACPGDKWVPRNCGHCGARLTEVSEAQEQERVLEHERNLSVQIRILVTLGAFLPWILFLVMPLLRDMNISPWIHVFFVCLWTVPLLFVAHSLLPKRWDAERGS